MGYININSIKPGMVLAGDVKDRNGRMLIKKGEVVGDKHLRILKIWGVVEADVQGVSRENVEEEALADIHPEILKKAEEYVKARFRHNDESHPAVAELMRSCILRTAGAINSGSLPPELPLRQGKPEKPQVSGTIPAAEELVDDDLKLGSLPSIFHRLVEVVNDSRSTPLDVAEVISSDTDLSARLLKVVNSAFYGLSAKVDTISRAVTVIGSNQLIALAMGMSVVTAFKGIPGELINMRSFWEHSVTCGIAARILSTFYKSPNSERFFVAGLLHDVGRLILYTSKPELYKDIVMYAHESGELLTDVENEVLGYNHSELGGILLEQWKFPVLLENAVRNHHDSDAGQGKLDAAVIHLADVLANAAQKGGSGECMVPRLLPEAWDALELPVSAVSRALLQMDYQADEILSFFNTDE